MLHFRIGASQSCISIVFQGEIPTARTMLSASFVLKPKVVIPKPRPVVKPKVPGPATTIRPPVSIPKGEVTFKGLKKRGFDIDEASFGADIDSPVARQFAKILQQYDDEFPGIFKNIRITAENLGDEVGGMFRKEFGGNKFVFSKEVLKNPTKIGKVVRGSRKSGWLAGDDLQSLIEHELGHLVDFRPAGQTGLVPTRFAKSYLRKNPPTRKSLSGYSETDSREAWAEAWQRIRHPDGKPFTPWERGFRDAMARGYKEKNLPVPKWLGDVKLKPKAVTPKPPVVKPVKAPRAKPVKLDTSLRRADPDEFFDEVFEALEEGRGGPALDEIGLALSGEGQKKAIVDAGGELRAVMSTEANAQRVKILHLGSAKPGGGSRAILEAIDEAIEKKLPLYLESTEDAIGFYRKLGMTEVPGKHAIFQTGLRDLQKIRKGLVQQLNKKFPK